MEKKDIKRKSIEAFSATINLGLNQGYSDVILKKVDIYKVIQNFQNKLIEEREIYLSLSASECDIVMSGQVEPHLKLGFINYPKFPTDEVVLKENIEALAHVLMLKFKQNRVVIEYTSETVMLEQSEEIDPMILKSRE